MSCSLFDTGRGAIRLPGIASLMLCLSGAVAAADIGGEGPPGEPLHQPLVKHIYTADPSAHVFENRLYIYPSHDIETGAAQDDDGGHFQMRDYHVLSLEDVGGEVTDHGVALALEDVPWASRQLWAPDAAHRDGRYYFYFPAKDREGVFRIGVAVGERPGGPFRAAAEPMAGTFSIDPAVFRDDDGEYYLYLGGIWGGQLQRWQGGEYRPEDVYPEPGEPALSPKVARLAKDMVSLAEPLRDVQILDENGAPLAAGDTQRRFFEAAWVHRHDGRYYLSWSTGDTHNIAYGVGDSPYGPFTYRGVLLGPVQGWTNHHSIALYRGQWYLFYHDSSLSGGVTHLRSVKMAPLEHLPDGSIRQVWAYGEAASKQALSTKTPSTKTPSTKAQSTEASAEQ